MAGGAKSRQGCCRCLAPLGCSSTRATFVSPLPGWVFVLPKDVRLVGWRCRITKRVWSQPRTVRLLLDRSYLCLHAFGAWAAIAGQGCLRCLHRVRALRPQSRRCLARLRWSSPGGYLCLTPSGLTSSYLPTLFHMSARDQMNCGFLSSEGKLRGFSIHGNGYVALCADPATWYFA